MVAELGRYAVDFLAERIGELESAPASDYRQAGHLAESLLGGRRVRSRGTSTSCWRPSARRPARG